MASPVLPLLQWYAAEGRALPWRQSPSPYRVWLSEVIMQQTRIDQGTAYYLRFLERFPTIHDLAAADTDTLMKLWEGLGYYSRARNMHATARHISQALQGQFPATAQELQRLKGIGPYTARAIASIACGEPVGVVDGNVLRVLSRYLADARPIDAPATRSAFQALLDAWIAAASIPGSPPIAGDFNQALMDLGAMVCTPRNPACTRCPLAPACVAAREGRPTDFPVKGKKLARKEVFQQFFLTGTAHGRVHVRRRPAHGLWANLWEIPNREVPRDAWEGEAPEGFQLLGGFKHVFTHMDMHIKVYAGVAPPPELAEGCEALPLAERHQRGFSRAVLKIFERYLLPKS